MATLSGRFLTVVALLAATTSVVLYDSALDERGRPESVRPDELHNGEPAVAGSDELPTGDYAQEAVDVVPAASDHDSQSPDNASLPRQPVARLDTDPYTSRTPMPESTALNSAAVVADMAEDASVIAGNRPLSRGPSIVDLVLPGPTRIEPGAIGSAEPDMPAATHDTELTALPNSGPSQSDLQLPGPGQGPGNY